MFRSTLSGIYACIFLNPKALDLAARFQIYVLSRDDKNNCRQESVDDIKDPKRYVNDFAFLTIFAYSASSR